MPTIINQMLGEEQASVLVWDCSFRSFSFATVSFKAWLQFQRCHHLAVKIKAILRGSSAVYRDSALSTVKRWEHMAEDISGLLRHALDFHQFTFSILQSLRVPMEISNELSTKSHDHAKLTPIETWGSLFFRIPWKGHGKMTDLQIRWSFSSCCWSCVSSHAGCGQLSQNCGCEALVDQQTQGSRPFIDYDAGYG